MPTVPLAVEWQSAVGSGNTMSSQSLDSVFLNLSFIFIFSSFLAPTHWRCINCQLKQPEMSPGILRFTLERQWLGAKGLQLRTTELVRTPASYETQASTQEKK